MKNIYEEIVERLPYFICRFLPGNCTITLVNNALCAYLDCRPEELAGRSFLCSIPAEECDRIRGLLDTLGKGVPDVTFEHPVVTPKGMRWQRWTASALFDTEGSVREIQAIGNDVTEEVFTRNEVKISENQYKAIFETTGTASLILDSDTISLVNSEFEMLTGYRKCQIEGKALWMQIVHPDDVSLVREARQSYRERTDSSPGDLEFRILDTHGAVKTVHARCHTIRGTTQTMTSLFDITGRKERELILKNSEEKYRHVVENANEYIVVIQDDTIRYMNRKARSLPCYADEDFLGRTFLQYIHPEDSALVKDHHSRRMKGEDAPSIYSFRICDNRARTFWVENNAVVIQWEGGPATLNFLTDITEQRRIEHELRQSEERSRLYLENASDVFFVLDPEFRILNISPRVQDIIGYSVEEIIHKDISQIQILKPQYLPKAYSEIARVMKGERIVSSVYEIVGREGKDIFIEVSAAPLVMEGRLTNIICVARNITERKRMEDSLRESERRYREILEEIEDGYYEVDHRGNFLFFNYAMCKILGYTPGEMMGMNNRCFMNDKTARKVFHTFNQVFITGDHSKAFDWELIRKDGTRCYVETSISLKRDDCGKPAGFRGIARDVTEQKNLEHQLYQSQKMEAIGTLAGGIAHDFNNILAGIIGYTELALMELSPGDPQRSKLDQVLKAGGRARDLVNQILTFSRRGDFEKKPIKIRSVVEEALKMLKATLPASIEIITDLKADDPIIEADPTQIHQIVLNLCTNAYHAVRDTGGSIEVKLGQLDTSSDAYIPVRGLNRGRYVELAIIDTGCGMTADVVERIFDPYYTTKSKDEGTGLGLAIVHGIVRSLGGGITVQSVPGKGSSFHIYLPEVSRVSCHDARDVEKIPCGCENVLVIDDEKSIIEITSQMLEHLGYRVTTHQSSTDALDHFEKNYDDFDLVISDLTMPRMNGDQLARRLLMIKPDIPIIICTGFSDSMPSEVVSSLGIKDILAKPVMLSDLATVVRRVLDEQGGRDQ